MNEIFLNTELVELSIKSLESSKTILSSTKEKIDTGLRALAGTKGIEYANLGTLSNNINKLTENITEIDSLMENINQKKEEIIIYSEGSHTNYDAVNSPFSFQTLHNFKEYDLSMLPQSIQENMKIETFHGTDVFVPKYYLMSLEDYEKMLENKNLSQQNYYKNRCKAFAGCQAMGLFSLKAIKLLMNKNLDDIGSEYYYSNEIKSKNESTIREKAIEDLVDGYPPILQVTQETKGNRHWVALSAIKAEAIFEAYKTGTLDESKITNDDLIVIDNAYSEKPIRTMKELNRQFNGEWGKTNNTKEDTFRIQVANRIKLQKDQFLTEMDTVKLGKKIDLTSDKVFSQLIM